MKASKDISEPKATGSRNWLKDAGMAVAGIIAIIYLLNPDAGIIELIPDNIPIIGNLDEAAATLLLFKVFQHFGWNVFGLFGKRKKKKDTEHF